MVDYMNARGMCPNCGEFRGWADGPPHKCDAPLVEKQQTPVKIMTQEYVPHPQMKYQIVLIWSGEHQAWWRPDGNGYTDDRDSAGRWWYEKAITATKHCGPEKKISFWTARRFEQGTTLEASLDQPESDHPEI